MSDHNKKLKYVHSPRFIWYLSKWPQSYLLNFVGANWWQFRCGRNTISNRCNERAIGNCFKISNQKCEGLCKPWKKVIALLKVRIKMQCCFKCRRGSWPLLIFAICLSIAAPASSYLLLIFPLQMFWVQQSPDDIGVVVLTVVVLVFLAFYLLLIFSLMRLRSDVVVLTLVVAVSLPSPQLFFLNVLCPAKFGWH